MIDSAAPTRVAARSNCAAIRGDGGQPADSKWPGEVVADSDADLQGFAIQRLSLIQAAELALHHAQVGRFRRDKELVAAAPHQRQPLRHPVSGLLQIAGDLGADAQKVERVRAPGFVTGGLADRERLRGQPPPFGHVTCEGRRAPGRQGPARSSAHPPAHDRSRGRD